MADKSKDLPMQVCRCQDAACPQWKSGCARAEKWKGEGRFIWLPLCVRRRGARSCNKRIDPATLERVGEAQEFRE